MRVKNFVKYLLQKLLGYQRYLFVFAKYKIRTLKKDKKEGDFFAFMDAIDKQGCLLDVGANLGVMTYHLHQRFSGRSIIAVEPMPSNIEVLKRIIQKYDLTNVQVITKAVGSEIEKEITMVLPEQGKVKMQGLAHVVHDSITEWNQGDQFNVISDTLDHLLGETLVAGIKMDIENFEFFALEGAIQILKRDHPVVYLELWENENRSNCFNLLESLGYNAHVQTSKGLEKYNPAMHDKQNFIFK